MNKKEELKEKIEDLIKADEEKKLEGLENTSSIISVEEFRKQKDEISKQWSDNPQFQAFLESQKMKERPLTKSQEAINSTVLDKKKSSFIRVK